VPAAEYVQLSVADHPILGICDLPVIRNAARSEPLSSSSGIAVLGARGFERPNSDCQFRCSSVEIRSQINAEIDKLGA
jgi:hypothetical protein